ncbi:hypothetical protein [Selenomonas noxia]|uniref:hypothetical protein n=1 Tax=Selenomonas noxia TaxID=135083 RepID=UPI00288AFFD8|nr:hypothetical protein [Selenomonas noxia]
MNILDNILRKRNMFSYTVLYKLPSIRMAAHLVEFPQRCFCRNDFIRKDHFCFDQRQGVSLDRCGIMRKLYQKIFFPIRFFKAAQLWKNFMKKLDFSIQIPHHSHLIIFKTLFSAPAP